MKKSSYLLFFPLFVSFFFSGCESIPGWSFQVDSTSYDTTFPGYRYVLRLADENLSSDEGLINAVKEHVESELYFLDFDRVRDPNFASLLIFVSFGKTSADPDDYRLTFPERDVTGMLSYSRQRADASFDVLPAPAEAHDGQKYTHHLALTAYDLGDYRAGGYQTVVWDIRVKATGDSANIEDVIQSMLSQALAEVDPSN